MSGSIEAKHIFCRITIFLFSCLELIKLLLCGFFHQQYIHTLESSLREEISRHAPLYGANLESLSMKELDTIARIHEEGLRQIHALQQRKGNALPHGLPQGHTLYPTTPSQLTPMAIGLPPQLIPNGSGVHSNGHVNGSVRPWFSHHT